MSSSLIAILCPITSRNCGARFEDQPIFKALLPSCAALELDRVCKFVFGYDSDDPVWSKPEHRAQIKGDWIECHAMSGSLTSIWNRIANDVWDYAIPVNDDLAFQTNPLVAVDIIKSRNGFGTVSFYDHAFPGLPTFYMVGSLHRAIFSALYPLPWPGAHQDSWIHDVYQPWGASEICADIKVHNRIGVAAPRFDYGSPKNYRERVIWGRRKVNEFLGKVIGVAEPLHDEVLLGTSTIL